MKHAFYEHISPKIVCKEFYYIVQSSLAVCLLHHMYIVNTYYIVSTKYHTTYIIQFYAQIHLRLLKGKMGTDYGPNNESL